MHALHPPPWVKVRFKAAVCIIWKRFSKGVITIPCSSNINCLRTSYLLLKYTVVCTLKLYLFALTCSSCTLRILYSLAVRQVSVSTPQKLPDTRVPVGTHHAHH